MAKDARAKMSPALWRSSGRCQPPVAAGFPLTKNCRCSAARSAAGRSVGSAPHPQHRVADHSGRPCQETRDLGPRRSDQFTIAARPHLNASTFAGRSSCPMVQPAAPRLSGHGKRAVGTGRQKASKIAEQSSPGFTVAVLQARKRPKSRRHSKPTHT
jgi:hypothetical protein